MAKLTGSIKV